MFGSLSSSFSSASHGSNPATDRTGEASRPKTSNGVDTVENGSPRVTRRNAEVQPPRQDVTLSTANAGEARTQLEAGPSARESALQAENKQLDAANKQLQEKINDLERRMEQLTMGASPAASRPNIARSADVDTTKNRASDPAGGHLGASDSSENFRAENPVKVHADFSNERDGTHLIVDSKTLFVINPESRSLSKPELLLRMMMCDNMKDKKEITQLLDLAPDLRINTPSIFPIRQWLEKGTPYGTVECLHSIWYQDHEDQEILDKNRAVKKNMLSEMARHQADGTYDYFLIVAGNHDKRFMLVSAVDARAGTVTSRSFPSAVCETRSPFAQCWDRSLKAMRDHNEDLMLFGIKSHPEGLPAPKAS